MAQTTFMAFNCLNADCGKKIKLPRPAKSGVYKVTCPHCGAVKHIRLKGEDAAPTAQPQAPHSQPETTDNSACAAIEFQDDFLVGQTYKITCPHCHRQEFGFATDKPGHRVVPCPACKGKIGIDVRNKTELIVVTEQLQMFKGKLTLLRRGWLNKEFHLSEGKNVIGRFDLVQVSDIAIKNDSSMSRRSVEIEVTHTLKGYTFKLTVLKATNPVLHNNNTLMTGESVSLNFGDSIVMGKTKFRFDKDE